MPMRYTYVSYMYFNVYFTARNRRVLYFILYKYTIILYIIPLSHYIILIRHSYFIIYPISKGCTSQTMPCGMFVRRRAEYNFIREYPGPMSAAATEWLANLEHSLSIKIQHGRNFGEYKLGPKQIPVDGFCE